MKKDSSPSSACARRPARRALAVFSLLIAGLLASCVTEQQVKSIVVDANQQMLLADIPESGTQLQADPMKATQPGPTVIARIDNFIAQHPDAPALTHPLRLRQAFLYLNQNALASATAAFDAIDANALNTERDKAIYRLRHVIVWWYDRARSSGTDFARDLDGKVRSHMALLATEADAVKNVPELRDYLLEMRAWIGLKAAGGLEGAARADAIKNALDSYGTAIGDKEGPRIAVGAVDATQPAFNRSVRLVLRTDLLLSKAADLAKGIAGAPAPVLANPYLQQSFEKKMRP